MNSKVSMKKRTSTKTIKPAVTMLNTAEKIIPNTVLMVLKPTSGQKVFS